MIIKGLVTSLTMLTVSWFGSIILLIGLVGLVDLVKLRLVTFNMKIFTYDTHDT